MGDVKMYDLTQRLSIHTPPGPSYMPLQIQYFKRIAGAHMGQGANGQIIKSSNHVGTHMDTGNSLLSQRQNHWRYSAGFLVGPGVVVDISQGTWAIMIYIHLRC